MVTRVSPRIHGQPARREVDSTAKLLRTEIACCVWARRDCRYRIACRSSSVRAVATKALSAKFAHAVIGITSSRSALGVVIARAHRAASPATIVPGRTREGVFVNQLRDMVGPDRFTGSLPVVTAQTSPQPPEAVAKYIHGVVYMLRICGLQTARYLIKECVQIIDARLVDEAHADLVGVMVRRQGSAATVCRSFRRWPCAGQCRCARL